MKKQIFPQFKQYMRFVHDPDNILSISGNGHFKGVYAAYIKYNDTMIVCMYVCMYVCRRDGAFFC